MITKEKILNLNKFELEELFNSTLIQMNFKSIDQSDVKEEMIEELKKHLSEDLKLESSSSEFSFEINGLFFYFRVTSKKTGAIRKVSKLRSKYIHEKGNFKFYDCQVKVEYPSFDILNENKFLLKKTNWIVHSLSDIDHISFKNFEKKFKNIFDIEFILKCFQEQDLKKRSLLEVVNDHAAQEFIKPYFFHFHGKKEKIKKFYPDPYKTELLNNPEDAFNILTKMCLDFNLKLFEKAIKKSCLSIKITNVTSLI